MSKPRVAYPGSYDHLMPWDLADFNSETLVTMSDGSVRPAKDLYQRWDQMLSAGDNDLGSRISNTTKRLTGRSTDSDRRREIETQVRSERIQFESEILSQIKANKFEKEVAAKEASAQRASQEESNRIAFETKKIQDASAEAVAAQHVFSRAGGPTTVGVKQTKPEAAPSVGATTAIPGARTKPKLVSGASLSDAVLNPRR